MFECTCSVFLSISSMLFREEVISTRYQATFCSDKFVHTTMKLELKEVCSHNIFWICM